MQLIHNTTTIETTKNYREKHNTITVFATKSYREKCNTINS